MNHHSDRQPKPDSPPAEHEGHGMHPSTTGAHASHDRHAGHSVAMFREKFWMSLALTVPVVVWSSEVQHWLGYTAPAFPGSRWIPAILGTTVFVYGGSVFLRGARGELSDHHPGMMTLISLAILVAFAASLAATLGFFEVDVWWEVVTEKGVEKVPVAQLRVGDVVLVRPGARVPADGTVTEGTVDVDESMITGESRGVSKGPGAAVVAGTVVAGGSLRVRVAAVGEQTALSGIMRLVAAAQASGSRAQALADRAAALLFYVAVVSGVLTLVYWWIAGDLQHALTRTATVLVIACPHALGLAIPLVIAISTSLGARNGLLVKDRLALERARDLDIVIFDKTGTLTRGAPALSGVAPAAGSEEAVLLGLAAGAEADSEHPIARAVVSGAERRGVKSFPATDFEALPGRGAKATMHEHRVA